MDYLKLIRFPNLVIIALIQYLVKWCLIVPFGIPISLGPVDFLLLVCSTVLVAAGGYAINDYFDMQVDEINDASKVVVGKSIKRREAIIFHFILSGLGVVLGFYLAYKAGNINFGLLHLIAAGLLWFYSTQFKRQFLIGNLVITFLSALVPLMVPVFLITANISADNLYTAKIIFYLAAVYAGFAWLTTLMREIIKDLEDLQGDSSMGFQTLAISWGEKKAKNLLASLLVLTLLGMFAILYLQFSGSLYSFLYVLIGVALPLLFILIRLPKAQSSTDYHQLSQVMKIVMIMGSLSMLVFTLLANYGL